MTSLLAYAPLEAFGIRFHGRMWLKFTKAAPIEAEAYGWRPFSWTADLDLADKWHSEAIARSFAERRCHGPFEIVKIRAESAVC